MSERIGPWELQTLLGVGALAEVWQVQHTATGALGAMKCLHRHLAHHRDVRAMFRRELGLLHLLQPERGLVYAREAGDDDPRPWVLMNLAPGRDLRRQWAALYDEVGVREVMPEPAFATSGGLPLRLAVQIVGGVARAVAELHAQGWAHGDIAPSNIVLDFASPDHGLTSVVLCDLGVARPLGTTGPMQGTHAYMAPEQARGLAWTPATDVFALGIVLWELVQGQRLFYRGPSFLSMAAVIEHEATLPAHPALAELLARALTKDPAKRTQSAADFAAALAAID